MKKTQKTSPRPRPVNSAEILFPHLSGAFVISDPDRHPHLAQLCDIITKKGGKYMDKSIECAKREYNERYYDPDKYMGQWLYVHYDASTWDFILQEYRKTVKDFNKTKRSNVTHLLRNAKLAALADFYYGILKDRLFWNEIIMLKLKSAPLSGIYNRIPNPYARLEDKIFPNSKKLQKIYEKICKDGELSINLLNELKQYANDTRRNFSRVAGSIRSDDRTFAASLVLRGCASGHRASSFGIISTGNEAHRRRGLQQRLLRQFAEIEGIWYQSKDNFIFQKKLIVAKDKYGKDIEGTETKLYHDQSGYRAYKFLRLNPDSNYLYDNLAERIVAHNLMFGDKTALSIKGFFFEGNYITFAVSQPYINDASRLTTEEQRNKFFAQFTNFNHYKNCIYNQDIVIGDLHNNNVLVDVNGDYYVVDCYAKFYRGDDLFNHFNNKASTKENPTPWYLRGLEGTEQSTDDVFSSCFFCKRCLVNEPFSYDAVAPFSMIYPRVCGHGATSSPQTRTCDVFLPRVSVSLFDNEIALLKLKLAAPSAEASKKKTPPPSAADIIAMLDSHEFSGEPYTDADKEILRQYQGKGGKAKQYGADTGILNQYYTPIWVCEYMYQLAKHYGYQGGNILEPSAATGNMLYPFYCRGDYKHIDAFEIDNITAKICKILYPDTEVFNQYFETAFLEYPRFASKARKSWLKNAPYDLVIGNPPYGIHKNLYSGYFTGKDHFQQIEMFFIYKGLQLLRLGGLLIYITSTNFMSTGMKTYATAKRLIGEIADFKDAYRLPSVFDNTPICTDIIVLQKK
ncbi:MAG: Eco57I restriction-modification methylase domain-containing protein [Bacteroidales bacterium]|nr:Eco57I restriction-modification methylase domain-containing protein [Bacteroidales bacterium]